MIIEIAFPDKESLFVYSALEDGMTGKKQLLSFCLHISTSVIKSGTQRKALRSIGDLSAKRIKAWT